MIYFGTQNLDLSPFHLKHPHTNISIGDVSGWNFSNNYLKLSIINSVVSCVSVTDQKMGPFPLGRVVTSQNALVSPSPLGYWSRLERWYFDMLTDIFTQLQHVSLARSTYPLSRIKKMTFWMPVFFGNVTEFFLRPFWHQIPVSLLITKGCWLN